MLALNIEANLWAAMQKDKKEGHTYASKFRTLFGYLLDNSNFELRLKVLTGDKKPEELVQAAASVRNQKFFFFDETNRN